MTNRSAMSFDAISIARLRRTVSLLRVFSFFPRLRSFASPLVGEGGETGPSRINLLNSCIRARLRPAHGAPSSPFTLRSPRAKRVAIALLIATAFALYVFCLPRPLFNEPYSSVLLGRDGTLLSARAASDGHWRFPMHGRVPHKFEQALLRFEDKRFYSHPGIDPLAMSRCISMQRATKW
jgi:hypothetical protein